MSEHPRSQGRDHIVEEMLRHLQRHAADERLRDLAGDVLGGPLTLREAVASPAYAEAVAPAVDAYGERYAAMDATSREQEARRAEAVVRQLDDRTGSAGSSVWAGGGDHVGHP